MSQVEQVDVLIVGSGPAGSSTALHLIKSNPEWAKRILVVDKARTENTLWLGLVD